MLARLAASPLMSPASPSSSTATSACFAAATASANPAVAVSVMPQPFAYSTLTLPARLDPLQRSHGVPWVATPGPRAERRDLIIGEQADDGDGAHSRHERQELRVVL